MIIPCSPSPVPIPAREVPSNAPGNVKPECAPLDLEEGELDGEVIFLGSRNVYQTHVPAPEYHLVCPIPP
jgi:hypothetical protein